MFISLFKFSIFQVKSCALWEGNKPAFFNTSIDWSWQWLVVKRECPVYLTQCEYQILCFACGLSLQSPEPAQAFIWNHRNQDSLNDTTKHTPGLPSWANSLPLAQSRLLSFSLHQPNLHPSKFFPPLSRSRIGCTPGGVGSGSTVMVFDGIRLTPARLIADFSWPRRKEMRDPVLWRRRRVLGYPDAATPVQYRWVWKPFFFLKGFVGAL